MTLGCGLALAKVTAAGGAGRGAGGLEEVGRVTEDIAVGIGMGRGAEETTVGSTLKTGVEEAMGFNWPD